MSDPYLYENTSILRNLLDIRDSADLASYESEQAGFNMGVLYDAGFSDFTTRGICAIHKALFGEIYEWAGNFRVINTKKSERVLAGTSVWYSDVDSIESDLNNAWKKIDGVDWISLDKETYVKQLVRRFSEIWQVHPFREGNTRTVVMMRVFFVEHHGKFVDRDLLAVSAGYVRDSFVMASLDQYSEYEHLEKILLDAILDEPIVYGDKDVEVCLQDKSEKYEKYATEDYTPVDHEYRADDEAPDAEAYLQANKRPE